MICEFREMANNAAHTQETDKFWEICLKLDQPGLIVRERISFKGFQFQEGLDKLIEFWAWLGSLE